MVETDPTARKKALLKKLAIAGAVLVAGVLVLLLFMTPGELMAVAKGAVERVKAWAESVGPVPFFAAMAVLPALGFPISVFSLLTGVLFVPQIGLPLALGGALLALGLNIALTYWLARYALRPVLEALVRKLGYKMPQVSEDNHAGLTLFIRITPGPPYFVQGYILGLAGVRFFTYMWLSWLAQGGYAAAMVIFGDSLMQGNGKVVFLAVSLLVGLMIGVKMFRRRMARQKPEAA